MINTNKFLIESDTTVRLSDVVDSDGSKLTGTTTITGDLLYKGEFVPGGENIPFPFDGTPGEFAGNISAGLPIEAGRAYTLRLLVVMPGGKQLTVDVTRFAARATA